MVGVLNSARRSKSIPLAHRTIAPLLLAVTIACDATPRVERGGTAVVGGYVDIRTMNPFATITDLNKAFERYMLYMPLVMLDSALTPRPWLATSWDTTAAGTDSLDITFRLRNDIAWQDGVRTTAHDVAHTFELARDVRSAYVDAAALALYAPEAEVIDSFTVRFRMQRHADYLEAFAILTPLPAHVLGNTAPEDLSRHPLGTAPVGNGPFRFERRDAQEWVFASNPTFPQDLGGPPPLDRLVYRMIPEQTSLVTELLTGRVHVASVRPPQVPQLEETEGVRVVTFPVPNWVFMALNTRLPYFDTRDERRAIALAVDRRALVDGIMGGHNTVGASSVTPVHRAFDATATVKHDPDSARMLLERAGWRDRDGDGVREDANGRKLQFRLKIWQGTGSYRELAEAIQAQLARVGVAANPEIVEFNTFLAQVQGREDARRDRVRDFDVAIGNWTDNMLRKDDTFLLHSRHAGSPRQWTGFNSARLDVLLDSIAIVVDTTVSNRLWREYQHAVIDESPLLFLFYALGINGVRTQLEGVPDGDPRGPIATAGRWWLRPER